MPYVTQRPGGSTAQVPAPGDLPVAVADATNVASGQDYALALATPSRVDSSSITVEGDGDYGVTTTYTTETSGSGSIQAGSVESGGSGSVGASGKDTSGGTLDAPAATAPVAAPSSPPLSSSVTRDYAQPSQLSAAGRVGVDPPPPATTQFTPGPVVPRVGTQPNINVPVAPRGGSAPRDANYVAGEVRGVGAPVVGPSVNPLAEYGRAIGVQVSGDSLRPEITAADDPGAGLDGGTPVVENPIGGAAATEIDTFESAAPTGSSLLAEPPDPTGTTSEVLVVVAEPGAVESPNQPAREVVPRVTATVEQARSVVVEGGQRAEVSSGYVSTPGGW